MYISESYRVYPHRCQRRHVTGSGESLSVHSLTTSPSSGVSRLRPYDKEVVVAPSWRVSTSDPARREPEGTHLPPPPYDLLSVPGGRGVGTGKHDRREGHPYLCGDEFRYPRPWDPPSWACRRRRWVQNGHGRAIVMARESEYTRHKSYIFSGPLKKKGKRFKTEHFTSCVVRTKLLGGLCLRHWCRDERQTVVVSLVSFVPSFVSDV